LDGFSEALDRRLEAARAGDDYRNYQRARDAVLRMKDLEAADAGTIAPSDYWREELANLDYMLDASPLVVENLRQHCYHVTGDWPYNYRSGKEKRRDQYAAKLEALSAQGDRGFFVHESPRLGGFGFEIDGGLVQIDTLKYFESLIAMEKAGVLDSVRGGRRVVWEIGSGWGGFAYQFKTLFPDVTYVMTDLPELFLFSGTYLTSLFPDARAVYYGVDAASAAEIPWDEADFVFVPNSVLEAVAPPELALTVNMVSFQEMTTEQVRGYVGHAADLGSPYLYSLNRDRSLYNTQLTSVRDLIAERYDLEVVDMLPVPYTKMLEDLKPPKEQKAGKPGKLRDTARQMLNAARPERDEYRHVVGSLRTRS